MTNNNSNINLKPDYVGYLLLDRHNGKQYALLLYFLYISFSRDKTKSGTKYCNTLRINI